LALAACVGLAAPAWGAQDPAAPGGKDKDYQVHKLGEIIISGETDAVKDIAPSWSVTAEDITESHSLTVPEALTHAPGVTVTTGRKNEPEIRIHGFNQEESLILIDGVPYYETNYGKLNLNQLPTEMIARIDVIKGAPSVLYGPNAMSGVINIITKKQGFKPSIKATGEAGNDGAYHLSAQHGNSLGKFNYWISLDRREADGWQMSDDFTPTLGTITQRPGRATQAILEDGGQRNNSGSGQTSLWAKVGVEPAAHSQYYLSAYFIDSRWGFPPSTQEERVFSFRPAFSTFASMEKYQDWGLDLSGEQGLSSNFKLRGKLFYHNHVDDYVSYSDQTYSQKIATSRFKDYFAGGALFADWDILSNDSLRFAVHYRGDSHQERADSYLPFAEAFSYTGSVAVQNDWTPLSGLVVVAGVSYDWFDVTKAESVNTDKSGNYTGTSDLPTGDTKTGFNPMVGASYTLGDTTRIFGSVARKTRFPTLQQLFSSRSGNIDLDAQHSTNYTLGVARPWGDKAYAEFSVFYHDIADRISRDGPHLDSLYRNYASVKTYGFEVVGEVRPLPGLFLRLDYTFLHARDDSPGRVTDDVLGAPEHKVDIKVRYIVPKLNTQLDLLGLYMASQYDQLPTPADPTAEVLETSGYFVANFKITQPIWEHFEIFGFVSNIFDRDYESESGYPGPGRNFWAGLSAKF
jgi:iron complex outermembrane receptor protein